MPTSEQIAYAKQLVQSGTSRRAAAKAAGIPESTLRYHLNGGSRASGRNPAEEVAGIRVEGDDAVVISDSSKLIIDPKRLMADTGFSSDEWEIAGDPVINCWGDPGDLSYQVKLKLRRTTAVGFVMPAVHVPPVDRREVKSDPTAPKLKMVIADQQAPYHCPISHNLILKFLEAFSPDEVVLAGDTIDLPDISRHKDNPEWHVTTQACINSGYRLLRDYREAAPEARMTKLMGNHDERIRNELLLRAERLYGITPAPTPEEPNPVEAMSVRNLLHLDELGIKLVEPDGNYTHAQHWIADDLAVRHGWLTGQNTADKSLRNIDHSLIVFHTHRQEITQRTVHTRTGLKAQWGVVGGALCSIKGGNGFAVDPNWQNGGVTAWVWPDGRFQIDLINIDAMSGVLTWGSNRLSLAS